MMTHVLRSRLIPALAVTAALVLSGCSGVGFDLGVAVDDREFSVAQLQEATVQLGTASAQPGEPQQVVADLALLPVLEGIFAGSPAEVSEGEVRQFLSANGVPDPGAATLAAARSRQYQAALSDPATFEDPAMADVLARAQAVTTDDLAQVDVEVNPRYGAWDVNNGGVVPEVPAWIQSSTDS
jgi:peptidoglycan hydrolase-like protein with peptidoglycan-binding domain